MAKTGTNDKENTTGTGEQKRSSREVFVIGVGASAGGLRAFDALFSTVPNDSVSYVIVQHLSSEHRSMLKELLAQNTVLEVIEAQQNMPVEPNRVYVIPNNRELTIQNNLLQLSDKGNGARSRTVDTFFKSLAADKKHRAIGVVLSGTGTDGTEGVVAIKKAGGIVIVQEPETAKFDGMPRNAINTGHADFILPPEAMAHEILNIVKVASIASEVTELVNNDTESSFLLILDMIHDRTGIDFSSYKRPTIIRRISRRMALTNVVGLIDYLDYLQLNPEEVETLSKDFLIGVTKFFRDEEAYAVLEREVIPALIDGKDHQYQLRLWVAGCSTGEEAYSLAILIREYMDQVNKELEVKIFASDIDRDALDYAGRGVYPQTSLTEVSEERLNEFFIQEGDKKYRVCQRIRRMVIFAPHNVINDPPFSKVDLVSCRNMLIYLNGTLQKRVIDKFHYALLIGGYLFLGSSESIGDLKSFAEVNKKWKIFRNIEPARALGVDSFNSNGLNKRSPVTTVSAGYTRDRSSKQLVQHSFSDLLNETILEEYGYAAVFIDEHFDVLHGVGKIKNYLDLPEENFTFNLLKLVSTDLSASIGSLLRRAMREKEKVTARNVQVREGKSLRYINVVVKPYLADKKLYQKFILVLLGEERPSSPIQADQEVLYGDSYSDNRVQELEIELQHTKDDLQAVVEELETSNEELQSTNEELLSSNEELQSTNEELQSLNEELHTINTEHQYKIKALVELDDDLNNYFRSTDIGQIFVDRNLIIRKYTPAATHLINLIESDIGRSIYHISNNLRYDNLIEDVRHVIDSNQTIEKEVQGQNKEWYQMRVLPYITQERKIDGAIIIFIQINEIKRLQLLHAGILDSSPNAILALKSVRDKTNKITDFALSITNDKAQEVLDGKGSLIGKRLWEEYPQLLEQGIFEQLVHVVETGELLDVDVPQKFGNEQHWLHLVAVKFEDGLVLTMQRVTERKLYEQTLKQQQEEIRQNAERFRTLLEAMPHITWTNKPNGENNSFNQYWYAYTGLTEEESTGWGWKKAVHPDDLDAFLHGFVASLQAGKIYNGQARILRRADSQYRWHLIKDVPVRDEDGNIYLWVGTATDIQDQKDAEEANIQLRLSQQREILKANLQTQELERDRISEALHNGLGQILYAAKLTLETLSTDNTEQEKAIRHIDDLLKESISITRHISSELTPSVLKDFGLKIAVEETISRLSNPKLKISSTITGFEDPVEYTVKLSLYRIIQELLNNIVKHSQATEASVEISREDDNIWLRVEDNGIGIENGEFSNLKGIGLRSIRNRVELLEGKMEIVSASGGTVFMINCKG